MAGAGRLWRGLLLDLHPQTAMGALVRGIFPLGLLSVRCPGCLICAGGWGGVGVRAKREQSPFVSARSEKCETPSPAMENEATASLGCGVGLSCPTGQKHLSALSQ